MVGYVRQSSQEEASTAAATAEEDSDDLMATDTDDTSRHDADDEHGVCLPLPGVGKEVVKSRLRKRLSAAARRVRECTVGGRRR